MAREPDQTVRVQHEVPNDLSIKFDRGTTSFNVRDCYKVAFAVGCGLTAGIGAVVGIAGVMIAIVNCIIAWVNG